MRCIYVFTSGVRCINPLPSKNCKYCVDHRTKCEHGRRRTKCNLHFPNCQISKISKKQQLCKHDRLPGRCLRCHPVLGDCKHDFLRIYCPKCNGLTRKQLKCEYCKSLITSAKTGKICDECYIAGVLISIFPK